MVRMLFGKGMQGAFQRLIEGIIKLRKIPHLSEPTAQNISITSYAVSTSAGRQSMPKYGHVHHQGWRRIAAFATS